MMFQHVLYRSEDEQHFVSDLTRSELSVSMRRADSVYCGEPCGADWLPSEYWRTLPYDHKCPNPNFPVRRELIRWRDG